MDQTFTLLGSIIEALLGVIVGFALSWLKEWWYRKKERAEFLRKRLFGPLINEITYNISILRKSVLQTLSVALNRFEMLEFNEPKFSAWRRIVEEGTYLDLPPKIYSTLNSIYRDLELISKLIDKLREEYNQAVPDEMLIDEIEQAIEKQKQELDLLNRLDRVLQELYEYAERMHIMRGEST